MPHLLIHGDFGVEACDLLFRGRNVLVHWEITTPAGRTIKGAGRVANVDMIHGVPAKQSNMLILEDNPPEDLKNAERLYAPSKIGGYI